MNQAAETKSIRDQCRSAFLSRKSLGLVEGAASPGAFIKRLVERHRYADAIRFMAHSLPTRDAIWWSVLCIWDAGGPPPAEADTLALRSAAQWVIDPSETHRAEAEQAGMNADADSPAGCAALAAARAGSDGKKKKSRTVDVKASVARMLAGAVLKTAAQAPAASRTEKYANLLAMGVRISRIEQHWQCNPACDRVEKRS